jgi:TolB-like protein
MASRAWRRTGGGLVIACLVAALALAGCGGSKQVLRTGVPVAGQPRVALLPLEDLTARSNAGEIFARMLSAELVKSGTCEVVEVGVVDALDSLGVRNPASLSRDQIRGLGELLQVAYLMTGSLLESGTMKMPEGELPVAGVALKLIEVSTTRVVWAEMKFRTGEDHETIFGWGRQRNPEKLASLVVEDVMRDFRITTVDSAAVARRRSR